jgi:hypothetical protein
MQPDLVIQRALRDVHDVLLAKRAATRNFADERTVLCIQIVVGKEDVRRALEKANDTALCFALREVKYVLDQRQRPKTAINQLWRIIEQLDIPGHKPRMIWKKPPTS